MRNLLHFLTRHFFVILFVVLEVIAFALIFQFNHFQRVRFMNSSNSVIGSLYKTTSTMTDFFRLQKVNQRLSAENALLKEKLIAVQNRMINDSNLLNYKTTDSISFVNDSLYGKSLSPSFIRLLNTLKSDSIRFEITTAKVIDNSVSKQYNYITLDKGSSDGVKPNMAIVNSDGIVGVITNVTKHFSTGPSLLNLKWKVSARIKGSRYFGSLSWDGSDYRFVQLNEIPFHVHLNRGDTITTSGYSEIFPAGIPIGTIYNYTHEGGDNFYQITVKVLTNFRTLDYVQVIKDNQTEEIKELEDKNENG